MSDMPERLLAWPSVHNYQRVSLAGGRPNDAVEYVRANTIPAAQPTVSPKQLAAQPDDVAALVDAAEKVINSYWHSTDGVITGIYDLEAALARVKGENK